MKQLAPLSCLLLAAASASAADRQESTVADSLDAAFAVVERAVAGGQVPGAIARVAKQGRTLRAQSWGQCDIENDRPMTTDTICWLASITKPVTVSAAMKLVETGKLNLDDPVEKYLPAFTEQRGPGDRHYPVTVRQIMSHSSGITTSVPTRPRNFFSQEWLSRDLGEIHGAVAGTRLEFEPGQKVQYSNAAPYVLGQIIALRSGRPYHQFVQETILDPLGMNDTFYILPEQEADRMAVVYRKTNGRQDTFFRFDPTWNMTMTMPDGGLFAPPADVAKLVQLFLDDNRSALSTETVNTMLSEQAPGWGLGWAVEDDGSFHHTGSAGTLAWGNPNTGIVGILFFQIQDKNTIDPLRAAFRKAVKDAFSKTQEDAN